MDCFVGTSRCGCLGGEICMLVRGKRVLEEKKQQKSVCVCPRAIEGTTWSLETEDQPYFRNCVTFPLSARPEKSSGLQLVEWEADTCMLQQILLLKWQCDLKHLRKDLIQKCLRKLPWGLYVACFVRDSHFQTACSFLPSLGPAWGLEQSRAAGGIYSFWCPERHGLCNCPSLV